MPDVVASVPIAGAPPPAAPASVDASGKALKTSAFKVPGAGNSATISVVTVVVLLVLWFLVTNLGNRMPDMDRTYDGLTGAPYNSSNYDVYGRAFFVEVKYLFNRD